MKKLIETLALGFLLIFITGVSLADNCSNAVFQVINSTNKGSLNLGSLSIGGSTVIPEQSSIKEGGPTHLANIPSLCGQTACSINITSISGACSATNVSMNLSNDGTKSCNLSTPAPNGTCNFVVCSESGKHSYPTLVICDSSSKNCFCGSNVAFAKVKG